ncbi:MAG: hypothetical protein GQ528_03380 [Woeseiaceae bacterium]|nr:hypothetical protein [Woeseiaceae bacterium]
MEVNRVESMVRSMYRIFPALTAAHLLREMLGDSISLDDLGHQGPRASVCKQVTNAVWGSAQV